MNHQARELYKCPNCSLVVEVVVPCGCDEDCLRCGDDKPRKVEPNTTDAAREKHLPVVTRTEHGIKVEISSVEHPMNDTHFIMWIEVVSGCMSMRKYLKAGEKPMVEFPLCRDKHATVRAYCNLHGLWQSEI